MSDPKDQEKQANAGDPEQEKKRVEIEDLDIEKEPARDVGDDIRGGLHFVKHDD
jgi:hypothetical protein